MQLLTMTTGAREANLTGGNLFWTAANAILGNGGNDTLDVTALSAVTTGAGGIHYNLTNGTFVDGARIQTFRAPGPCVSNLHWVRPAEFRRRTRGSSPLPVRKS